jgi:hypothetical protein
VICNANGQWETHSCTSGCIDGFGCQSSTCGSMSYPCCTGIRPPCLSGLACKLTCNQTTCDPLLGCSCTGGSSYRCVPP